MNTYLVAIPFTDTDHFNSAAGRRAAKTATVDERKPTLAANWLIGAESAEKAAAAVARDLCVTGELYTRRVDYHSAYITTDF